ncbi:MAG: hypothetical protein RIQ89_321, partial [Bacteroidota bacterium]
GGSFPSTIGRIQHGFDCRPDLVAIDNPYPPNKYIGKFYLDSLVHDPVMLQYLIQLFGADKIALGSDYPFPLGEHIPGSMIKQMALATDTKELLLSGTALKWLNKSKVDFI